MPSRRYRPDTYDHDVNGVTAEELPKKMREAHDRVRELFPPHTGVLIITFDFGQGGGLGYISNGDRENSLKMLEEWIAKMRMLA